MKKILVLSSFPAPYRVDVFKGLAETFELDVFFETNKDQNRSKDFFVSNDEFQYNIVNEKDGSIKFYNCIKNLKSYDLVLAYDWYLEYALRVEVKCMIHRIPYIINCDGAFIVSAKTVKDKCKEVIKHFFVRHAVACLSSGKSATNYFKYYGALEKNIHEHPFTSLHKGDILQSPVLEEEKKLLRKKLKLEDKFTVISVGQFIERKGFDTLLSAWKNISMNGQLIIVGGGEERAKYEKMIVDYSISGVKMIDFIPKQELIKYYMASDVFVLPTREDIWGLVVNEAMAVGIPVITTERCNAGIELIENDVNGFIVPVNDIHQMADKIQWLMEHEDIVRFMGINNIKKIKNYTLEKIVESHKEVFLKILSAEN